jgi:Domain of unknown function (DUF1772)
VDVVYAINDTLLLLGASMYFGTGWSTELFTVPIYPQLTVENYALHFVPQIKRAVKFFFALATVMMITAVVMIVSEWGSWYILVPIVVLAAVVGSSLMTVRLIFPINRRLAEGVTDPQELKRLLGRWIRLNRFRLSLWTSEWVAMAVYFGLHIS